MLLFNILFLFIIGNVKKLTSTQLKIVVFLWSSALLLFFYFVFYIGEIDIPWIRMGLLPVYIPLYLFVLVLFGLMFQMKLQEPIKLIRSLLIFLTSYLSLYFSIYSDINAIMSFGIVTYNMAFNALFLIMFMVFGLYVPLVVFRKDGSRAFRDLNIWRFDNFKKNQVDILLVFVFLILLMIILNLIAYGYPVALDHPGSFKTLFLSALLSIFYYVLVVQFVCFGMTTKLLEEYLEGESFFWGIIIAGATVYMTLHFMSPSLLRLPVEFLFGIGYSYLYLKTRSLSYGIILASIIAIFSPW